MQEEKKELTWLDNPIIWRNARGISLGIVVLFSPLIYFGIVNNFKLDNFLNYDFGALIVFMTFVSLITTFESRSRAFEDEFEYDSNIGELETKVKDNAEIIRPHITVGIKSLGEYNKKLQLGYDKQKTLLKIDKLKARQDNVNIKLMYSTITIWFIKLELRTKYLTWRKNRLTKRIDKLNKIPKRDKRFKPYKFSALISSKGISNYKRVGNKETKSNPKKVPLLHAVLKMPIKGFTMSLGGFFFMLLIVDDPKELAKFYLWFLIVVAFTIITQYIITRYKTKTQYKYSLSVIIYLQGIVIDDINKPIEVIEEDNTPRGDIK
jgi:hypothetical protein